MMKPTDSTRKSTDCSSSGSSRARSPKREGNRCAQPWVGFGLFMTSTFAWKRKLCFRAQRRGSLPCAFLIARRGAIGCRITRTSRDGCEGWHRLGAEQRARRSILPGTGSSPCSHGKEKCLRRASTSCLQESSAYWRPLLCLWKCAASEKFMAAPPKVRRHSRELQFQSRIENGTRQL